MRWMIGRKRNRRKAHYLKSPAPPWTGRHSTTRKVSARRIRHDRSYKDAT